MSLKVNAYSSYEKGQIMLKQIINKFSRRHDSQTILLSTCMRCGSTWVYYLLAAFFKEKIENCKFFRVNVDPEDRSNVNQRFQESLVVMANNPKIHVFKTHRVPVDTISLLLDEKPDLKIVNVHRDFKDVLVSRLFYERYRRGGKADPNHEKSSWISEYNTMSDAEMVNSFVGSERYYIFLEQWACYYIPFEHERYLVLRYEEMLADYERNAEKLARFVGIEDKTLISQAIENCKFSNMATDIKGRSPGKMVKYDHCRKGVVGDHKTYMDEETIRECNKHIKRALTTLSH